MWGTPSRVIGPWAPMARFSSHPALRWKNGRNQPVNGGLSGLSFCHGKWFGNDGNFSGSKKSLTASFAEYPRLAPWSWKISPQKNGPRPGRDHIFLGDNRAPEDWLVQLRYFIEENPEKPGPESPRVTASPLMIWSSINWDPPKWLVYFMENPVKMDDWGVPPFQENPIWREW